MTTPTFNQQMVTKLQAALLANPLATSVTVDGVTTTFANAQTRLDYFMNQVAREQSDRQNFQAIRLGGFTP